MRINDNDQALEILNIFDSAIKEVNNAKNNPDIQKIIRSRIHDEISKIDKNDLFYDYKLNNLMKVAENFDIKIENKYSINEQRKNCQNKLNEIRKEIEDSKEIRQQTVERFFDSFLYLPKKEKEL